MMWVTHIQDFEICSYTELKELLKICPSTRFLGSVAYSNPLVITFGWVLWQWLLILWVVFFSSFSEGTGRSDRETAVVALIWTYTLDTISFKWNKTLSALTFHYIIFTFSLVCNTFSVFIKHSGFTFEVMFLVGNDLGRGNET